MPGHAYITRGTPDQLRQIAGDVATAQGFRVEPESAWTLKVGLSSMAASLFLGAFVAYCDFKVHVVVPGDGTSHLVLERNNPWWTGLIGIRRVKNRAIELANAWGNEMQRQGVQILQRIDS
jgi:hypothetical protein